MRWVRRIAIGLVVIFALAAAVLYGGSEWVIRRNHVVPLPKVAADRSLAGVPEGGRLARLYGCRACHGENGQGSVLFDAPPARMVPPPFALSIAGYSDAELARLIRHGVKRDGSSVFIMPSNGHIADADIAKIMGWMRTLTPSSADLAVRTDYRPLGRALLLAGTIQPSAQPDARAAAARPADAGRYFTVSVCGDCHSLHSTEKAHDDGRPVPALAAIGAAYDDAAFLRLLRTGVGMTPRDLGIMGSASKASLRHLTDAEIASIHAYLKREAARASPQ